MRALRTVILTTFSCLLVCCSRKAPVFPQVGLVFENGSAVCAFYSSQLNGDDLSIISTNKKFKYTEDEHQVEVEWASAFGDSSDRYEFSIIVDGVRSTKIIDYSGKPVLLLDKPFKVTLKEVKR